VREKEMKMGRESKWATQLKPVRIGQEEEKEGL